MHNRKPFRNNELSTVEREIISFFCKVGILSCALYSLMIYLVEIA